MNDETEFEEKKLNHYNEQINLSTHLQKTQAFNLSHLSKLHAN